MKPIYTNNTEKDIDPDIQIMECLSFQNPKNFFLFAGAGSGKTGSLVKCLKHIENTMSQKLLISNQKIGVITYTNAACDEIKKRVDYNTFFHISTIHSFCWMLIKGFNSDIRIWLKGKLNADIKELLEKEKKGKKGSDASKKRLYDIDSKRARLVALDSIAKFRYDPLGDNREKDSLQHTDVLQLCSYFLEHKLLMQQMLINSFPVLLIDESQDTNKSILDAVMAVTSNNSDKFILGLFGDMMQRIYFDGKDCIHKSIPPNWVVPQKTINYRSPARIVKLLNEMRSSVDGRTQRPAKADEGCVRIFIRNSDTANKVSEEENIREKMSVVSGDIEWNDLSKCKILLLEHHMAAMRYGFNNIYSPLNEIGDWKNSLLDGTHPALSFLSKIVIPFYDAIQNNDDYEILSIIRKESPLFNKKFMENIKEPSAHLSDIAKKVSEIKSTLSLGSSLSCGNILRAVKKSGIFTFPEILDIALPFWKEKTPLASAVELPDSFDAKTKAILSMLDGSLDEIRAYHKYVTGGTPFATHHGIKGLEFERVFVVLDDNSARGSWFSYDKILGAKPKTKSDLENQKSGKGTSLDRTMRLLYVTCSRSTKSLAIVVYTENPQTIKAHVLESKWFLESEVDLIG